MRNPFKAEVENTGYSLNITFRQDYKRGFTQLDRFPIVRVQENIANFMFTATIKNRAIKFKREET